MIIKVSFDINVKAASNDIAPQKDVKQNIIDLLHDVFDYSWENSYSKIANIEVNFYESNN